MPLFAVILAASAAVDLIFVPAPRMLDMREGLCEARAKSRQQEEWGAQAPDAYILETLRAALDSVYEPGEGKTISLSLSIDPAEAPHDQGYVLEVEKGGIRLAAHDLAGLRHGAMTLKQLARQYAGKGALPCLRIEDWPDFPHRGIMLDVARCKVPEMDTLRRLVDTFAEWKINQLQMYTEHTFAYRNHPEVWIDASPMTPAQIRVLDAYCRERGIELVPNQNSFGHMGRWLSLPRYASLAETPGGSDLCPVDPGSIALIEDMYNSLLPCFSSGQVNVGCDETWTLGKGRSKEACEERGTGVVYLEFLMKIHAICAKHGRTMQFWGDIIMNHPELIPQLPEDIIAMEWGYEANHPFADHGKKFAESGVAFYVVPGTSTWNTFAGKTDNAMANLRNAAENGLANGAIGYLITDWGDGGHWQFEPASYPGFAYGAGVSWSAAANAELDIVRALDTHVFEDEAGVMGRLSFDLGNAYQVSGYVPGNSSVFYYLIRHRHDQPLDPALKADALHATIERIDAVMAPLDNAAMNRPDADLIKGELRMTADLMRFACRLGIARIETNAENIAAIPQERRNVLAAELEAILPEFRQLWLARNRSGGLKESTGHFEDLIDRLRE
jgi:hexosaminidase